MTIRAKTVSFGDIIEESKIVVLATHYQGDRSKRLMLIWRINAVGRIETTFHVIVDGIIDKKTDRLDTAIYWYNNK